MLVWRKKGILVPVITLLTLMVTEYSVEMLFNNQNYYQDNGWAPFIGLSIAGALCRVLGNIINRDQDEIYIDKKTGEEVVIKNRHTFFFISVENWGVILPTIGVIMWIIY